MKVLSKTDRLAALLFGSILVATPVLGDDAATSATGGATGAQVRAVLHLVGADNVGAGATFKLGIALPLTGPQSYLGIIESNGARLAVAQIKAAGGPNIELVFKDLKSADPQAGELAVRELGDAGVPAVLTSYGGDLGAMLPGLAQYKMLGLDGATGASALVQGKPYFWGMRAIEPDDDVAGALEYWTETNPQIKRVSLVYEDQGPANATILSNFNQALAEQGFGLASTELTVTGATDYSTVISELKAAKPDAVFLFSSDAGAGYFMTQFVAAGLITPVIGTDFDPQAAKIAGHAFDNYAFATDWFDAAHPLNAWAKLFVDSYSKQFGAAPDIKAANYYEDTFAVWALIRRILGKAGNINSGDELQKELIANHAIKSIYGGDDTDLDDIMLDTTTHTVIERPLGVYKLENGIPHQVAGFDLGGANFKLIN
jgi:branched-chain amino acid transport system substrate-binding protein